LNTASVDVTLFADVESKLATATLTRSAGRQFAFRNLRALSALERQFTAELRILLALSGRHTAQVSRAMGGLVVSKLQESTQPTSEEANRVEAILAAARLDEWTYERIRPLYALQWFRVAKTSVDVANSKLGIGVRLTDRLSGRLINAGGTRAGLLDLSSHARAALYRTIAIAREEQFGPMAIAREIENQVPAGRFVNAGSRYRAKLIARSETLHASRVSTFEVYRSAEHVTSLIAYDALLGDTDDECIERDGQEYTFEEAYVEMANTHPQCTLNWGPNV
jgi:hypothetical protein